MKKMLLAAACLLAALTPAAAQSKPSAEAAPVQQAIIGVFDGFSALSLEKIMRHCTPDVTILEDGVVWNADSIATNFKRMQGVDFKRVNSFDFLQTEVRGNTAWTSYYNQADVQVNGKPRQVRWLESAVLVKETGGWKVKMLHSTVIERKGAKQ
ncbi:MAG: nuclear transport factor 2 family protein [Cytophagales bacterium]|nr:nuclear transport factor 2 family protein [Cytophagales bacterium]